MTLAYDVPDFAKAGDGVWMVRVTQAMMPKATVGLRGILAQGLGMLIYRLTGDFTVPFAVAVLAFAWAAWQMWRLSGAARSAPRWAETPAPAVESSIEQVTDR